MTCTLSRYWQQMLWESLANWSLFWLLHEPGNAVVTPNIPYRTTPRPGFLMYWLVSQSSLTWPISCPNTRCQVLWSSSGGRSPSPGFHVHQWMMPPSPVQGSHMGRCICIIQTYLLSPRLWFQLPHLPANSVAHCVGAPKSHSMPVKYTIGGPHYPTSPNPLPWAICSPSTLQQHTLPEGWGGMSQSNIPCLPCKYF